MIALYEIIARFRLWVSNDSYKCCRGCCVTCPYYKDCDIYVQPSIHEGYCLTLAEAKVINKIIISTDFSGAREQFENYKNGTIVNNSVESFVDSILKNIKI